MDAGPGSTQLTLTEFDTRIGYVKNSLQTLIGPMGAGPGSAQGEGHEGGSMLVQARVAPGPPSPISDPNPNHSNKGP